MVVSLGYWLELIFMSAVLAVPVIFSAQQLVKWIRDREMTTR